MTGRPDELTDPQRRALRIEIAVVLAVTFGLCAYTALLNLIEAVLLGLAGQTVALNPRRSPFDLIDLGLNLAVGVPAAGVGRARRYTCCGAAGLARARSVLADCGWRRTSSAASASRR